MSRTSKFAALPIVQQALKLPQEPYSVLNFFFAVDYDSQRDIEEKLVEGTYLNEMLKLWFGAEPEYDSLCQHFRETIRAVGKHDGIHFHGWPDTVDGLMAQLMLCDQLPRNVFRSTSEAFAYDEKAYTLSRKLGHSFLLHQRSEDNDDEFKELQGIIYPLYVFFIIVALGHSESLSDHELSIEMLDLANARYPHLSYLFAGIQRAQVIDHKAVIEKFGRYPHRNKQHGRTSSPEELEWLADVDHLPAWAKSQLEK